MVCVLCSVFRPQPRAFRVNDHQSLHIVLLLLLKATISQTASVNEIALPNGRFEAAVDLADSSLSSRCIFLALSSLAVSSPR